MSDQKEKEPWALGHQLVVVSKGGEAVADAPALSSDPGDFDINEYLPDDFQRAGPQHRRGALGEGWVQPRERENQKREVQQGEHNDEPMSLHEASLQTDIEYVSEIMRVASRLGELQHTDPTNAQRVAQSSFREALKLLAEPRQKPVFRVGVHASGEWGHAFPQGRGFVQRDPDTHAGQQAPAAAPSRPRMTEADAWAKGRAAADALLAALQHLKDRGARPNVTTTLALARKVAGFVNRTRPKREPDGCQCNTCEDARAEGRPLPRGKAHHADGPRSKQRAPKEYGRLGAGGDPRGGAIVRKPRAEPPQAPKPVKAREHKRVSWAHDAKKRTA